MSLLVPYRSVSDYNEHMFLLILFHSDKLQKPLALYSYEYLPPDCNNQSPFLVISVFFSASFQGQVSINRLTDFLNLPELDPNNVEKTMPEHSEFFMSFRLFLLLLTVILGK